MVKVHEFLEMWQGSHNLFATQRESRFQSNKMIGIGYISDTEEIINASWSLFQHHGAAAFELGERSPLPPASSANYLPSGGTQILNLHRIKRINCHPF
jgi:hypothetical protein